MSRNQLFRDKETVKDRNKIGEHSFHISFHSSDAS
jgi:hypothetical protein